MNNHKETSAVAQSIIVKISINENVKPIKTCHILNIQFEKGYPIEVLSNLNDVGCLKNGRENGETRQSSMEWHKTASLKQK